MDLLHFPLFEDIADRAAATLSYTLHTAGKLALVYGSFAGVVATLVSLYIGATTLMYGAEINAVLLRGRAQRGCGTAHTAPPPTA